MNKCFQLVRSADGDFVKHGIRFNVVEVVDGALTQWPGFNPAQHLCHATHMQIAQARLGVRRYVEPVVQVPRSVTPRQLRLALLSRGVTQAMVLSNLQAISDPIQREAALIEWEHALDIRRDHPLVLSLAASLGITSSAEVDAIFVEASKI